VSAAQHAYHIVQLFRFRFRHLVVRCICRLDAAGPAWRPISDGARFYDRRIRPKSRAHTARPPSYQQEHPPSIFQPTQLRNGPKSKWVKPRPGYIPVPP